MMNRYVLIINAGSSSIKFALYRLDQGDDLLTDAAGQLDGIGIQPYFAVTDAAGQALVAQTLHVDDARDHRSAMSIIRDWLDAYLAYGCLVAVGHRVVHGGLRYGAPIRIDAVALADLEQLIPLAPLHQPHNLEPIRILLETRPELPQVACFDTAFHHTQPAVATRLALPRRFAEQGICRYGFHGLSYEYIASVMPDLDPRLREGRIIVAHLGNGASLCALKSGRSIATTMGFSPLDGLVMGTRCGSLDPGVLLYLMTHYAMDAEALAHLLYHQSGLLGVSGLSSDMRRLLNSENPQAQEAVDLFVYRISRELGSLAAALGGLDALIFTGGIGEHAALIREKVCHEAAWLGVVLNPLANNRHETCISKPEATVSAWIVPTNENLMIARHTVRVVDQALAFSINPL